MIGLGFSRLAAGLIRSWRDEAPLPWLRPLGAAYGWGAAFRRGLHAAFGHTKRAARPVISLGNLTVGGTGKTPLALVLAGFFLDLGRKPAILSRGYGREPSRPAPLVISRGTGPLAGPTESGDEPWLMASELPAARVVVDPDRCRGARTAVTELGADVLILDDGFQYLSLAADCRILLAQGPRPFGNGAVLPAGPLREPLATHRLAHILVSTGEAEPSADLAALAEGRPVFAAAHHPLGWRPLGRPELKPPDDLGGRPVLAFCGLGRPESFQKTLQNLNLNILGFLALSDHQNYDRRLLTRLSQAFSESGADFMVTTAKDAVKLPPAWPWPVLVLKTELRFDRPQAFFKAVLGAAGLTP